MDMCLERTVLNSGNLHLDTMVLANPLYFKSRYVVAVSSLFLCNKKPIAALKYAVVVSVTISLGTIVLPRICMDLIFQGWVDN